MYQPSIEFDELWFVLGVDAFHIAEIIRSQWESTNYLVQSDAFETEKFPS